jgi:hypothetical protein
MAEPELEGIRALRCQRLGCRGSGIPGTRRPGLVVLAVTVVGATVIVGGGGWRYLGGSGWQVAAAMDLPSSLS